MFVASLNSIIDRAIERGKIVGASIIVARDGEIIFERQAGFANREEKKAVSSETIFRLASMTKPIVSAAALLLVEKGVLDLEQPITHWLPDFKPKLADGSDAVILLKHLLNHTSGLSYSFLSKDNEPYLSAGVSDGVDDKFISIDENLRRLASVPLFYAPGKGWGYSLAIDVLGAVMEKACIMPLPDIIKEFITGPLGMLDTFFRIRDAKSGERLAYPYVDDPEGGAALPMTKVQKVPFGGTIHFAVDRIFSAEAYPSGGGGMVGTARDYLVFLESIRSAKILSKESIKLMTQDSVAEIDELAIGPGYGFGMGFAIIRDPKKVGTAINPGSYTWGGGYGTDMFIDPTTNISAVILTNTTLEGWAFSAEFTSGLYVSLFPKLLADNRISMFEADNHPKDDSHTKGEEDNSTLGFG
jgi:CubicO group peptidase (beta-lactamase class C family)